MSDYGSASSDSANEQELAIFGDDDSDDDDNNGMSGGRSYHAPAPLVRSALLEALIKMPAHHREVYSKLLINLHSSYSSLFVHL